MARIPSPSVEIAGFPGFLPGIILSRRNLTYVCQNCGAASARWQGKCEACGEWNSMVEEGDGTGGVAGRPAGPGRTPRKGRPFKLEPLVGETHEAPRLPSGMPEFDRVTG